MTMTNAAAGRSGTSDLMVAWVRTHPLAAIVLLAAVIRLPLAFWPNFHHPDEIFQYLEPAWRMLGHDGIVSWEWREGMRSWLLPGMMAGPVALGDWIVPGGTGAFILPRLVAALASLSIVVSAFAFGARVSRTHAVVAGLVAAVWFELVYFAPHTLGEPLATAVILPAALLLTRAAPSRRDLLGGGALLALAVLFRFQYAPASSDARDRRLLGSPQPDIAGHRGRHRRHGRERGRRCGARCGSLQLARRQYRAKPAARSRRRIRRDACHRLYRLLLVDVVDRHRAAVVRGLQGLAACAAAAVGRARQHRVSQPDRSQGISLHLPVGRAARHRRSPWLGRLDAGASEQALGPPVCGTADRSAAGSAFPPCSPPRAPCRSIGTGESARPSSPRRSGPIRRCAVSRSTTRRSFCCRERIVSPATLACSRFIRPIRWPAAIWRR